MSASLRKRDIFGMALALFLAGALLVREFLQWDQWHSVAKLGVIVAGAFLIMTGLRTGSRAFGMTGLAVSTLISPFVFMLNDVSDAADILVFAGFVALPLVVLLELVCALKAGKEDVSLAGVLLRREMELKRYHFLPMVVCLGILMSIMVLMSIILNLGFISRMFATQGFLLWEILLLTGLALIFTVPFIGPFTVRIAKKN